MTKICQKILLRTSLKNHSNNGLKSRINENYYLLFFSTRGAIKRFISPRGAIKSTLWPANRKYTILLLLYIRTSSKNYISYNFPRTSMVSGIFFLIFKKNIMFNKWGKNAIIDNCEVCSICLRLVYENVSPFGLGLHIS